MREIDHAWWKIIIITGVVLSREAPYGTSPQTTP